MSNRVCEHARKTQTHCAPLAFLLLVCATLLLRLNGYTFMIKQSKPQRAIKYFNKVQFGYKSVAKYVSFYSFFVIQLLSWSSM